MRARCFLLSLAWLCGARAFSAGSELYERLNILRSASAKEIKKGWHLVALRLHPDKIDGGAGEKEAAAERFKRAAEAYEVLNNPDLKAAYDRTGVVPSDKDKSAAGSGGSDSDDEEYGFEGSAQGHRQQQQQWGFGGSRWHYGGYNSFEVKMAQQRARRVRSYEALRSLLQSGPEPRCCSSSRSTTRTPR